MKKTKYLLFLLLINFTFAQNKLFLYEYKFIPDSLHQENVKNEIMVLNIEKDRSEFYGFNQFKNDSIVEISISKGFPPPPLNLNNKDYRIIKSIPNTNTIHFISRISSATYNVTQQIDFDWKLTNETQKILDYNTQKAVTTYGGRTWIAWFTKDIPIQDGPYKFCNLPGLILKIEDAQHNHIFEIKAIEKSPENFKYPENKFVSPTHIDFVKYKKLFQQHRKNPLADIIDRIQDVKDSNGYVVTSKSQIIKNMEESAQKQLQKDNNIIEIDLLK